MGIGRLAQLVGAAGVLLIIAFCYYSSKSGVATQDALEGKVSRELKAIIELGNGWRETDSEKPLENELLPFIFLNCNGQVSVAGGRGVVISIDSTNIDDLRSKLKVVSVQPRTP